MAQNADALPGCDMELSQSEALGEIGQLAQMVAHAVAERLRSLLKEAAAENARLLDDIVGRVEQLSACCRCEKSHRGASASLPGPLPPPQAAALVHAEVADAPDCPPTGLGAPCTADWGPQQRAERTGSSSSASSWNSMQLEESSAQGWHSTPSPKKEIRPGRRRPQPVLPVPEVFEAVAPVDEVGDAAAHVLGRWRVALSWDSLPSTISEGSGTLVRSMSTIAQVRQSRVAELTRSEEPPCASETMGRGNASTWSSGYAAEDHRQLRVRAPLALRVCGVFRWDSSPGTSVRSFSPCC